MGKPGAAQVMLKVLLEATGADGGKRMGWLELQCNERGASAIVFVRPAIGGDEGDGTEVELTAGERKFVFSPKDMSTHNNPTEPAAPYLRRRLTVPTPEIAALASQPEMDLRITPKARCAGSEDAGHAHFQCGTAAALECGGEELRGRDVRTRRQSRQKNTIRHCEEQATSISAWPIVREIAAHGVRRAR